MRYCGIAVMTFRVSVGSDRPCAMMYGDASSSVVLLLLPQFVDVSKEIILAFWSDSSDSTSGRSAFYLSW